MFNAVLLVCALSYLAVLSWRMFAVLAVGVAVTFMVSKYLIANLSRHARGMRERQDEMFETYKGMLEGAAQLEVDTARRSLYYQRELDAAATQLRGHEQDFRFFWDLNRTTTAALVLLLLGSLIEASRWLHAGAVVTSFMLLITYCTGPFATVLNLLQLFAQSKVSLRKIDSLQIGAEQPLPLLGAGTPRWQRIRLSSVEFAYPGSGVDERFALGPLDLEVARGEVVFITGGNGSGKSTLLKLLLGLHEPAAGQILLDEMRIENPASRHAYQSLFAIVLSEFHLFRQVLGRDGTLAADPELAQLLEMFNMGSVVESRDGYLSTVQLSQGQRKRLALVSALAQDKDIYVLDEWAADQDPHYRKVFYHKIIPWMRSRGKTLIAVTHDDRYFDVADRCVEFEMGRIRDDNRVTRLERTRDAVVVSAAVAGLSRVQGE
jgi:cyclic peptide transporter